MYKMFTEEKVEWLGGQATPFYYYDTALLQRTLDAALQGAGQWGYHLHYALKANANPHLLRQISETGLGADCVSGGEVKRALETGFPAGRIVYAGVGKSDAEIRTALEADIFAFNSESMPELEVINSLAGAMGKTARVALRINPDVDAHTHHYITTGLSENKFGIPMPQIQEALDLLEKLPHVDLTGLHFHIGSQITDMSAFRGLCNKINDIQQWFVQRRHLVGHINVGGGLGISYKAPDRQAIPDFDAYFRVFREHLHLHPGQELHFEPGRALVAQAGSLLARVLYVKQGLNKQFAILDAGMSELMRPALYQAYHKIENLSARPGAPADEKYDVVGPVCESADTFGKAVSLPATRRGDLVAIRTAGAYGEAMASDYNLRGGGKRAIFSH